MSNSFKAPWLFESNAFPAIRLNALATSVTSYPGVTSSDFDKNFLLDELKIRKTESNVKKKNKGQRVDSKV
jgi:hypothetical protein